MDIKQKFGKKVKELRQIRKFSQEDLALEADLDRTYINSIENGRRNVSLVNIEKIAKALKVKVKDLLEEV
ncbi:MAG: helix-turn-helix transcriptional regulator [Ignavibacteria bacterium]|nr:helix-turn-helix transcriptional regulator [Ignavibacteria bacterium]